MKDPILPAARAFVACTPAIPALKANVMEALRRIDEADSLRAVAEPIERDPALALCVLRVANSARYSGLTSSGTVAVALGRLGLTQSRQLLVSAVVVEAFRGLDIPLDMRCFWRHSVATGLAAGMAGCLVGGRVGELLPENPLYTAGLLHHVGILAEALGDPARFQAAQAMAILKRWSLSRAERTLFGFDHAQAGAALLQQWGFPQMVWEAALYHHDPEQAPEPRLAAQAVHAAAFLCHEMVDGGSIEGTAPWVGEPAFYELGWDTEHLPLLLDQVRHTLERADQMASSLVD